MLIAGMLRNTDTGRYHPIYFHSAPKPSEAGDTGAVRHRSWGHDNVGYDTQEEAQAATASICKQGGYRMEDLVWDWNGKDSPHMTWLFVPQPPLPAPAAAGEVLPN